MPVCTRAERGDDTGHGSRATPSSAERDGIPYAGFHHDLTPAGERRLTLQSNEREGANNAGVFIEEQLSFGERLIVTAGARHDAITYRNQDYITPTRDASRTFRRITPKIGATWKLGATHSLYVNVGGGVEVPAGNETDPASTFGQDSVTSLNPLLEPIRSTTYEVGLKRILTLGGNAAVLRSASYDVALYDTEVRNEIVPYRGGRFYFSAGKVRRLGAELGVTIVGQSGLSARGALTLNRHRYITYAVDSVHYGVPGRFANYRGKAVVGVPSIHYGGTVSYAPDALPLRLEAGVSGIGRYFADDANTVGVPGHAQLDARLAFDDPVGFGGGFGLRGFVSVNNVTGRRYIGSAFLNPDVLDGAAVAFEPGRPREVVVGVTVGVL